MIDTFFKDSETIIRENSYGKFIYDRKIIETWKDKFDIKLAKNVLEDIRSVAKKNQLKFFLIYGTLLGAYRDKNFIAHDNDLDLGVFIEDKLILKDVIRDLVDIKGFKVFKISLQEESIGIIRDNIPVEFALFSLQGDNYSYDDCKLNNIPKKFLSTLEKIDFLGSFYYMASSPKKYLLYQYGDDWNEVVKDFYNPYKRYIERPITKKLSFVIGKKNANKIGKFCANFVQTIYQRAKRYV